jgi:hypothetical protein
VIDYAGERRTIPLSGDHPLQPHVEEGGSGCWRRATAGPRIEMDCTFPLVRAVSAEGEVLREHRIDRAVQRTSPELLAAMEATIREGMAEAGSPAEFVRRIVDQAIERNRWAPLMRGAMGTVQGDRIVLWEQLSNDFGDHPATLHILDGEGRYLARQDMGLPLQAVAITDSRIHLLALDPDTGLKRLRTYRMP